MICVVLTQTNVIEGNTMMIKNCDEGSAAADNIKRFEDFKSKHGSINPVNYSNKGMKDKFKNLPLNKRLDYKILNSIKKKRKNLFLKRFEENFLNLKKNKYFGSIEKFIMPKKWKQKVEINDFVIEELDYKFLSTKSKIQYKNENQLINATLNMRIENGVKIWFSVRVALGVEAARGMITRDEFIIIDRVNKQVIKSSLDIVEKEFKMKLSFDQLESALTGNLLYGISSIIF